jgi:uncharacterized protein involved in exopolysaccharide biosynthesis
MNGTNAPLSIGQMVAELWARRRLLIVATLATGILAAIVSLFIQPSYRATVLLAPPEKSSESGGLAALAGQFSGLADLAGVNLGGGGDIDQSIALMTSRQFTEQFITSEHVLQAMYPKLWDTAANRWIKGDDTRGHESVFGWIAEKIGTQGPPIAKSTADGPSMWEAVKKFDQLRKVSKDKKTSLIVLTVDWRDPVVAARWANHLVSQLNQHARDRAIEYANRSLVYLNGELNNTHVLEMQQTIYRLIEREMRTQVSANVREEYAFRVLDPAIPPEERESPHRTLITLAAMFIAAFCVSLWIIFGPPRRPADTRPSVRPS